MATSGVPARTASRCAMTCAWLTAAASTSTIIGLPAVIPQLKEIFRLSHGEAGLIVTALWIPHAGSQLIAGWIAPAVGVRRLFRWTLCASVVALGVTLLAPSYASLLALRTVTGLLTGASFVLAILYAAAHTPPARQRESQAMVGAMSYVGCVVAYAGIAVLLEAVGWRAGYLPSLGFYIAALVLLEVGGWVDEKQLAAPGRASTSRVQWQVRQVLSSFCSPRVALLAIAHLCSFGVIIVVASWLTAYFVRLADMGSRASLLVSALVLVAGVLGRVASGRLFGRMSEISLIRGGLTCSGLALFGLAAAPSLSIAPMLAFAVLGCCSLTYGPIVVLALGRSLSEEGARNVGSLTFLATLAASTLPAVIGWLVDRHGSFGPGFVLLGILTASAVVLLPSAKLQPAEAGGVSADPA